MRDYGTALSLAQFAEIMELNVWSFAGIGKNVPHPQTQACACCFPERTSESKGLSRQHIAQAIRKAEQLFTLHAKYSPAPRHVDSKSYMHPQINGTRDYNPTIRLPQGYLQKYGARTVTLIDSVEVARDAMFSGSTFNEFFTASATVPSGTTEDELFVFFAESDRPANGKLWEWQLRPLVIEISGTTATITGDAYLLAKPELTEKFNPACLDVEDDASYVTEIDVYRVTYDSMVTGYWRSCTTCNEESATGCFDVIDDEYSLVMFMPECTGILSPYDQIPKRIEVGYLAGYPLENGKMEETRANVICWLAASLLACEKCLCDCVASLFEQYREVPKFTTDTSEGTRQKALSADQMRNRFNSPRWGAILAEGEMDLLKLGG